MRTAPYFTAIGLLTLLHAFRVIRLRRTHRVGLGDGGRSDLLVASRIFGNHAEYAPLCLVFLVALEFVQAPGWYLHLTGSTLVLGRTLHAMGLLKSQGHSRERVAGMMLTFASLILGAVGVTLFTFIS